MEKTTNAGGPGDELDLDRDELLDPRQAAKLIKTHLATIYRWIESGKLRAWKRGGRLLVRKQDVAALLQPVQPKLPRPKQGTRRQSSSRAEKSLREAGWL